MNQTGDVCCKKVSSVCSSTSCLPALDGTNAELYGGFVEGTHVVVHGWVIVANVGLCAALGNGGILERWIHLGRLLKLRKKARCDDTDADAARTDATNIYL